MKILAFGHKSRTGKDTSTKFLVDLAKQRRPELRVERRAFADKVKDIAYQLYQHHGLQPGPYYDEFPEARAIKLPLLNMDPVEVWVATGNKFREIYAETWVDFVLLDCSADIVIISDLRYPNEAKRVMQLGGLCLKMEKEDAPIRNTVADNALNGFDSWYHVFRNNGSKQQLESSLTNFIDKLGWIDAKN